MPAPEKTEARLRNLLQTKETLEIRHKLDSNSISTHVMYDFNKAIGTAISGRIAQDCPKPVFGKISPPVKVIIVEAGTVATVKKVLTWMTACGKEGRFLEYEGSCAEDRYDSSLHELEVAKFLQIPQVIKRLEEHYIPYLERQLITPEQLRPVLARVDPEEPVFQRIAKIVADRTWDDTDSIKYVEYSIEKAESRNKQTEVTRLKQKKDRLVDYYEVIRREFGHLDAAVISINEARRVREEERKLQRLLGYDASTQPAAATETGETAKTSPTEPSGPPLWSHIAAGDETVAGKLIVPKATYTKVDKKTSTEATIPGDDTKDDEVKKTKNMGKEKMGSWADEVIDSANQ